MAHRILASECGEPMPITALDAVMRPAKYPRAALPGARGGRARDEDPDSQDDPNIVVASSPGEAAYRKLFALLGDKLTGERPQQVLQELVSDLQQRH